MTKILGPLFVVALVRSVWAGQVLGPQANFRTVSLAKTCADLNSTIPDSPLKVFYACRENPKISKAPMVRRCANIQGQFDSLVKALRSFPEITSSSQITDVVIRINDLSASSAAKAEDSRYGPTLVPATLVLSSKQSLEEIRKVKGPPKVERLEQPEMKKKFRHMGYTFLDDVVSRMDGTAKIIFGPGTSPETFMEEGQGFKFDYSAFTGRWQAINATESYSSEWWNVMETNVVRNFSELPKVLEELRKKGLLKKNEWVTISNTGYVRFLLDPILKMTAVSNTAEASGRTEISSNVLILDVLDYGNGSCRYADQQDLETFFEQKLKNSEGTL